MKTPSGSDRAGVLADLVYVPQRRQNLASFISVDADASLDDYGTIRILRLPSNTQVPGPSQMANQFASDPDIQEALLPFTRTNSKPLYGNLLTLPAGDGLLYVQPLYTLREAGEGRYPVFKYVLVSFGQDVGIGETLTDALYDVLGLTPPDSDTRDGHAGDTSHASGGGQVSDSVRSLLEQAEAKFAEAEKALQAGDLAGYQAATNEAKDLVQQALDAAAAESKPSKSTKQGKNGLAAGTTTGDPIWSRRWSSRKVGTTTRGGAVR